MEGSTVAEVSVAEAERHQRAGGFLLDVREPDEFEAVHAAGAVLIPLGELADRLAEIPTGGPVHVICRSGSRSMRAAEFLHENGMEALNVAGGTLAWQEAGLPVVTGGRP